MNHDVPYIFETLYEIFTGHFECDLVHISETLQEAQTWKQENDPTSTIIERNYTKKEWMEEQKHELPGLDGYYT